MPLFVILHAVCIVDSLTFYIHNKLATTLVVYSASSYRYSRNWQIFGVIIWYILVLELWSQDILHMLNGTCYHAHGPSDTNVWKARLRTV